MCDRCYALHVLFQLNCTKIYCICTVIFSILQMRKLNLKEVICPRSNNLSRKKRCGNRGGEDYIIPHRHSEIQRPCHIQYLCLKSPRALKSIWQIREWKDCRKFVCQAWKWFMLFLSMFLQS